MRSLFRRKVYRQVIEGLAELTGAGLRIDEALAVLAETYPAGTGAYELSMTLIKDIGGGASCAEAMEKGGFDKASVLMISAGETAGSIDKGLAHVHTYQELSEHYARIVIAALVYPAFLFVMTGVTGIVITFHVLPSLARLGGSEAVHTHRSLWAPAAVGIMVCAAAALALVSPKIRTYMLRQAKILAARLPLIGTCMLCRDRHAVCRTTGIMLESGVPLVEALSAGAGIPWSEKAGELLTGAVEQIQNGAALTKAFAGEGLFGAEGAAVLGVGQRTGRLGGAFLRLSDMYERRLRRLCETAASFVEPLAVMAAGATAAFVIIKYVMPVFELGGEFM